MDGARFFKEGLSVKIECISLLLPKRKERATHQEHRPDGVIAEDECRDEDHQATECFVACCLYIFLNTVMYAFSAHLLTIASGKSLRQ